MVGRGVRVDDLPVRAHLLVDERQAARGALGLAVGCLRLLPEARDEARARPQSLHAHVAHVELHVLDLRVEALSVAVRLLPSLRHRAVVVEEDELRRVPVELHHGVGVGAAYAVNERVEGFAHGARLSRVAGRRRPLRGGGLASARVRGLRRVRVRVGNLREGRRRERGGERRDEE